MSGWPYGMNSWGSYGGDCLCSECTAVEPDDDQSSTDWQCPDCKRYQYKVYGFECDECGAECPEDQRS